MMLCALMRALNVRLIYIYATLKKGFGIIMCTS